MKGVKIMEKVMANSIFIQENTYSMYQSPTRQWLHSDWTEMVLVTIDNCWQHNDYTVDQLCVTVLMAVA